MIRCYGSEEPLLFLQANENTGSWVGSGLKILGLYCEALYLVMGDSKKLLTDIPNTNIEFQGLCRYNEHN
jgi:hypothetical protein